MTRRPVTGTALLGASVLAAMAARLLAVRAPDGSIVLGWPGGVLGSLRLDAVLAAASAGAVLGAAGAMLQTLLRNPLASPFVLGVTGGAGTGVAAASVLAAVAGVAAPTGPALAVPASVGALAALAATLLLSRRGGTIDPVTLVLGGVIVGAVCSGTSTVLESLLPPERRGLMAGWMFGRIPDVPDAGTLLLCACCAIALVAAGVALGPSLDAASMSDDEASAAGVRLGPLRLGLFVGCGVATAATVVLCGPIAFVGLLAPHGARAAAGARNRVLVPLSAVAGAGLLVGADAVRQWVDLGAGRLPIGAVTAVLGGAAFLVLLRRTAMGWRA